MPHGTKYSRMDQINCGRQPLKNFTWSILKYLDSYIVLGNCYEFSWVQVVSDQCKTVVQHKEN